MGFQIDGLDWLMNKWYNLTSVILADDMGLGKTVQIAAFLGLLGSGAWNVYPALVVVPNSTLQSEYRCGRNARSRRPDLFFAQTGSENLPNGFRTFASSPSKDRKSRARSSASTRCFRPRET